MTGFLSSLLSILPTSLPSLPTLPSLPSLPVKIQRRFLSFLLRRSLGRFVKEGGLDAERIEGALVGKGGGEVKLEGVRLDEEAINDLIPPSLPLKLESGSLGTLSVFVPWLASSDSTFSLATGAPFTLSLSHLHLELVLLSPSSSCYSSTNSQREGRYAAEGGGSASSVDLAESVVSVADEFVRSELNEREEQDLFSSIHQLHRQQRTAYAHPSSVDPFDTMSEPDEEEEDDLPPGSFQPKQAPTSGTSRRHNRRVSEEDKEGATSLLAGLVEGLLARLRVDVRDVRVRVRLEGKSGKGEMELEFRIGDVGYRDENIGEGKREGSKKGESTKALRFGSVAVFTRPSPSSSTSRSPSNLTQSPTEDLSASTATLTSGPGPSSSRLATTPIPSYRSPSFALSSTVASSSSASSSSDEDEDDQGDELAMSMAVADLRESIYESAQGESFFGMPSSSSVPVLSSPLPTPSSSSSSPHPPSPNPSPSCPEPSSADSSWKKLASFGQPGEQIVVKLSKSSVASVLSSSPTHSVSATSASRPFPSPLSRASSATSTSSASPSASSSSVPRAPSSAFTTAPFSLPLLDVDISTPALTAFIDSSTARFLFSIASCITPPTPTASSHSGSATSPSSRPSSSRTRFTARVPSIFVLLAYSLPSKVLKDPSKPAQSSQLEERFWNKPKAGMLGPGGELEFKVDGIEWSWQDWEEERTKKTVGTGRSTAGGLDDVSLRPNISRSSSHPSPLPCKPSKDLSSSSETTPRPSNTPPSLSLVIQSISLFEYLPTSSSHNKASPSNTASNPIPILLFDSNLASEYDAHDLRKPFPTFEHHDWRGARAGKKGWKVRPPGECGRVAGGAFKGSAGVEAGPAVQFRKNGTQGGSIDLLPIHLFLDLTLAERLLPFLRHAVYPSSSSPSSRSRTFSSSTTTTSSEDLTPPATPARRVPLSLVIDDLDAQEQPARPLDRPAASDGEGKNGGFTIRCPMVRVEVRCPAPRKLEGRRGEGGASPLPLRSGILILDVHQVDLHLEPSYSSSSSSRQRSYPSPSPARQALPPTAPIVSLEWANLLLFLAPPTSPRAQSIVNLTLLSSIENHDPLLDGPPLRPLIQLLPGPISPPDAHIHQNRRSRSNFSHAKPPSSTRSYPLQAGSSGAAKDGSQQQSLRVRLPSVRVDVGKEQADGLQYFADDLSRWLDEAFDEMEDGEPTGGGTKKRDEMKLIGSRFFGLRGGEDGDELEREAGMDGGGEMVLSLEIAEVDLNINAPRSGLTFDESFPRIMHAVATDIEVLGETQASNKKRTTLSVSISDLRIDDVSHPDAPVRYLHKTINRGLDLAPKSILFLRLVSTTDLDSGAKETDILISTYNFTFFVSSEFSWAADLALFAKTPAGAFEDVTTSDITRISIQIEDSSIHVAAPTLPGAVVFFLGEVHAETDLVPDESEIVLRVEGTGVRGFAIDDVKAPVPEKSHGVRALSGADHWKLSGFASLVEISQVQLTLKLDSEADTRTDLEISTLKAKVMACADSMVTLAALAGDISKLASSNSSDPVKLQPARSNAAEAGVSDLLASLDEEAFGKQQPSIVSDADFIADDLPRNADYLESYRSNQPEPLNSFENVDFEGRARPGVVLDVDGETITLLDPQGIQVVEDYWLAMLGKGGAKKKPLHPSQLKFSIKDCDVSLLLHDGFDWHHTRKSIEDEIKAVRRRLEKIRQLLASGQTPDESIEQAGTKLFNSIYIGIPSYRATGLEATDYLAALGDDDHLDLGGPDDTSQTTSFQSVKGRADRTSPLPTSSSKTRSSRRRKLARSRNARIEINLVSARVELKQFAPGAELASKLRLSCRDVEILDHIKTSTWKKFLTQMRSDSRGNVREAGSDMVSIELRNVRPIPDQEAEEGRLRAKILPLRLHVDQDALDFLKRFFSFKDLRPFASPTQPPSKEAYLQHVEIFPIELKLDYKPKRVDYRALREGKTIELMNFFHFDGAEMTLRRVTLSGVTGWARLFDMLNDLWTPDVKANQLAEIISGVSPIRSLVNVGSGVADLILLPIEQYKKDGRIVRGVQRGTTSFVKSTALEAIKLGARLATGTQVILEKAEEVLGGRAIDGEMVVEAGGEGSSSSAKGEGAVGGDLTGRGEFPGETRGRGVGWNDPLGTSVTSNSSSSDDGHPDEISRYAHQPADVREGISNAYDSLARNINSAAETILAVPMEVYERSGNDGPVRAVVRAIPIAVLKPMIGASEAVSKTLFGLRNTLDPGSRQELEDKYK